MANPNIPRGLVPVRHRNGAPYNGQASVYFVPASNGTALFVGDPVKLVTTSTDPNGIPTVTQATAGATNNVLGSVLSLSFGVDTTNALPVLRDSKRFRAASVAAYVLVADDPEILFEVQENGTMGVGAVGKNVDLVSGVGSTVTGWSGWMLNSGTVIAPGPTLQMRIIAPVLRADNDPSLANAKWLCSINIHALTFLGGV